jgi:ferritin
MILSGNVLKLLTVQYSHEIGNFIFYTALQSWADMRGLTGTSAFFRKQAEGERTHADKILEYIHSRNQQLTPDVIGIPTETPSNFTDLFTLSLEREQMTSELILSIKAQAEAESDGGTCQWLLDPDGLIKEQVEEENIIQTILDRIAFDPTASPHFLDLWIGGL